MKLIHRARHGLTVVVASDPELATAVGRTCSEMGCFEIVLAEPPSQAGASPGWTADCRGLPPGNRPDLVILCDEAAIKVWFDGLGRADGPRSAGASPGGASLILASGDPDVSGSAFLWYAHRWHAQIEVSERVTTALTRPPP